MTQNITIHTVDKSDDAVLAEHIAFENAHGVARFGLERLREWGEDDNTLLLKRLMILVCKLGVRRRVFKPYLGQIVCTSICFVYLVDQM